MPPTPLWESLAPIPLFQQAVVPSPVPFAMACACATLHAPFDGHFLSLKWEYILLVPHKNNNNPPVALHE